MRAIIKTLTALSGIIVLAAAPMRTVDPLQLMGFLQGSWSCTYTSNGRQQTYTAKWEYVLGKTWLRETSTWQGGGDVLMLTYVPQSRQWRAVGAETDGTVSVFEAPDTGVAHINYRSAYPDTTMRETYDRISPQKYKTHFTQAANGKTLSVTDVCTKNGT